MSDEQVIILDEASEANAVPAVAPLPVIDEAAGADDGKLPPQAVVQDDGSVILPLRFPVTLRFRSAASGQERTETFAEFHMHRMRGADMRAIEAAKDSSKSAVAMARSCRMGEAKFNAVYDLMDAADIAAASKVVLHFL